MHRPRPNLARRAAALAVAVSLGAMAVVIGADKPAEKPAARGGVRPLLQQLNAETQSLYSEVQAGVCRIQLPPPKWAGAPLAEQDNPVHKWGDQLDPAVRQALEAEQKNASKGQSPRISATVDSQKQNSPTTTKGGATTGPAAQSQTGSAWTLSAGPDDVLIFRPGSGAPGALQFDAGGGIARDGSIVAHGGRVAVTVAAGSSFTPNNIGLLLDAQGHMLVPICIEREQFNGEDVRVMVGPGQMATAKFVGSDRQCNITLLKLDKPLGTPVKVAAEARPAEGALTMFLAPNSGVGRLMIWTNELRDWGVVVSMDGGVYGFTRQGQFLSLAGCKPAVDQLLKHGAVRRAKLGLGITEVTATDPARESTPALATSPAVRITEIAPSSPADRAGLKAGDLILTLNDQPTGDPSSFAAAMSGTTDTANIKLLREGREQAITIELGK